MINLEAFEPFLAEGHTEMVAFGKYGVLVLTNGTWIPTEITEADFGLYVQVSPQSENQTVADIALFDAALNLNSSGHSSWPLVELI
jgi:hypothetical protein